MTPQQTATAEWSVLSTLSQTGAWIDALSPSLFADSAARRVFDWMMDTREQTGLWSPIAVGCWLENEGFDADAVDAMVDMLVATAPIYSDKNMPSVVGFLIQQQGRRNGKSAADIALDKHNAGCVLTEREIAALTTTEASV